MELNRIIKPALALPADSEAAALKLAQTDGWHLERKVDGVRLLVHVEDGEVVGVNRKGMPTTLHPSVSKAFSWMTGDWVFDGELVKGVFLVFDMPRAMESINPTIPYSMRRDVLEEIWPQFGMPDNVRLLPSMRETTDKLQLALDLRKNHAEGAMLKDGRAPYAAGARIGTTQKWKFVKDVDCFVLAVGLEGKKNLSIGVFDEHGGVVDVGTVTALAGDGPRCKVGDVVTIKCLYASADNRLVQPTYPKIRDDKSPEECTFDQILAIRTNKEV